MDTTLTDIEIRKIFCIYVDSCELQQDGGENISNTIENINDLAILSNAGRDLEARLLLTPFCKISNDHAIELAKIFRPDEKWVISERREGDSVILLTCKDYFMWIWLDDSEVVSFDERYHEEENIEAHGCESESCSNDNIVDIIDRIRELGYALPYKGKSLFELGIAIDKTKNK